MGRVCLGCAERGIISYGRGSGYWFLSSVAELMVRLLGTLGVPF